MLYHISTFQHYYGVLVHVCTMFLYLKTMYLHIGDTQTTLEFEKYRWRDAHADVFLQLFNQKLQSSYTNICPLAMNI